MGDMQKTIRFPDELAQKIQAIAEAEDRTFSYVVVRALEKALATDAGLAEDARVSPPGAPAPSQVPVSEEAPAADTRADRIPGRPASPRSQPKAQRRQKASDAMSAALARQQALNKSKGI